MDEILAPEGSATPPCWGIVVALLLPGVFFGLGVFLYLREGRRWQAFRAAARGEVIDIRAPESSTGPPEYHIRFTHAGRPTTIVYRPPDDGDGGWMGPRWTRPGAPVRVCFPPDEPERAVPLALPRAGRVGPAIITIAGGYMVWFIVWGALGSAFRTPYPALLGFGGGAVAAGLLFLWLWRGDA